MPDQTIPARPQVVRATDGTLSNPDGWAMVLVSADEETVVAAWDDAGVFHQWEPTEVIVRQLMDALTQFQTAYTRLTPKQREAFQA